MNPYVMNHTIEAVYSRKASRLHARSYYWRAITRLENGKMLDGHGFTKNGARKSLVRRVKAYLVDIVMEERKASR